MFWLDMVKNGCGQYDLWTLKLTVSQKWTGGINLFFSCGYNSTPIKMQLKIFGLGMVKNGCGQTGDGTLKRTVSEEWTDGITDYLHVDIDSQKLKADQNILGGHGQKWVWWVWSLALKLTVSQKWTNAINWFFAWWYKFQKAKSWFNDFWVGVVKSDHGSLVNETLKSAAS